MQKKKLCYVLQKKKKRLTFCFSSTPIYALVLEKQDAIQAWRILMGPTDSNKARNVEPNR